MSGPRAAVLLRTYSWDDYAFRSALRIWDRSAALDFFILADETKSGPLDCGPFKKLGHTEGDFERLGLPCIAPGGLPPLWWNCDYGLYDAALRLSGYDYYVLIEDDVALNLELRPLVDRLAAKGLQCVTAFEHRSQVGWAFAPSCADLPYARKTWTSLCFMLVSGGAARHLLSERLRLARLRSSGQLAEWPFCDGFVSSAVIDAGLAVGSLRKHVNLDHFSAMSLYLESDPRTRGPGSLCHAVLDIGRYWSKFASRGLRLLLANGNYAELARVRSSLLQLGRPEHNGWRIADGVGNLALDRPARQSSLSSWSRRGHSGRHDPSALDARGANCGVLTGGYGFHTEAEEAPWWAVDLGQVQPVGAVRIFNSTMSAPRARWLHIDVSADGAQWEEVYRRTEGPVFGGIDDPLICRLTQPALARHVRVVGDVPGPLHLDEVEVYGPDAL